MTRILRCGAAVASLALIAGCGTTRIRNVEEVAAAPRLAEEQTISFEVSQDIIPSVIPSADRGRAVFAANCASCHGESGKPVREGAPDFSTADWIRDTKPPELREVIAEGPQHGFAEKLTLQEQWDALAYARFLSTSAEELREYSALFGRSCNVCHGNRGHGNGFLAPTMQPQPRNLEEWQVWGNLRSDQEIWDNIYYGVHWSAMPPWRGALTEEEVWHLVDFIRSLQYQAPEN